MDTAEPIRTERPLRRVNPSGDVVYVARWRDCNGRRRVGFKRAANPAVHIRGTYAERGPCERDGMTCCAVHALAACHEMDARYGEAVTRASSREIVAFGAGVLPEAGEWVYVVQAKGNGLVKVGYSKAPASRIRQLQTASADTLRLVMLIPATLELEQRLHRELGDLRVRGEWFTGAAAGRLAGMFAAGVGAWV